MGLHIQLHSGGVAVGVEVERSRVEVGGVGVGGGLLPAMQDTLCLYCRQHLGCSLSSFDSSREGLTVYAIPPYHKPYSLV